MEFSKPQVTLDTSLADLYADEHREGDPKTTLVPCYWCSDLDYSKFIPKTSKYLYQGTPPPNTDKEKRELVIQCLSLECQRFTFAAGRMETVLFDIRDFTGRLDAIKTMNVLPNRQRPNIIFAKGIDDLMQQRPEAQFALVVPHEKFASRQQTVDSDVLYKLLSKRYLALSGLPTPQTSVLDLDDSSPSVASKLSKAVSWIRSFDIPRVFKTQQGMSSVGTFLIRTEQEREDLIDLLSENILRTTLDSVNSTNAYLYPSSLLSQEMITQAQECFATSFFVRRNGDAVFLGACRQDMDSESNAWLGASICYLEQGRLRQRLWPVVCQIATYLHGEGYYGPAGADIMLANASATQPARHWIIDLNVRMTGSLTLAFLRGHFSERRGLHEASITQRFKFKDKRDDFRKLFATEVAEGRLIIVAWFYDTISEVSWGNLIVGAEDGPGLKRLVEKVRSIAI
ncbi:MAG: hypothetical protein ASARMPREDX12_003022 [Alectoria sarmentosa]|nr:MAG: hypothetical protein ASARMPREDX12_003022 [Alectoria sarmentosa]